MNSLITFPPPSGISGIESVFGKFSYTEQAGGNVIADPAWAHDNLLVLRNVCSTGLNIQLHKLVAPLFEHCLRKAMAAAPLYKVRMLGGFCARHMRHDPKMPLSTHSWGCAFDINWDKNPMGSVLVSDLPLAFVSAFQAEGWDWGGAWRGVKDAMHFQYAVGC